MKRPLGRARRLIGPEEPHRGPRAHHHLPGPLREDDEVPEREPGADLAAGRAYS